ncbi:MAG: bifunctional oligoribonuclease/PAP phosphatase NrnA [Calditrichaceae bacterium]|nr:bifunctional oligoribonuclease/PAP phosphatase NrnA [Calditrichaceae bacterium]
MKKFEQKFIELNQLVQKNNRIILTSHVYTDGDAMGCLISLYDYLKSIDKDVEIIIPGEVPPKYAFLHIDQIINHTTNFEAEYKISNAQLIIIVDVSSLKRLNGLYSAVKESKAKKVCIDHHPFEGDWIDLDIVDTDRVATGEMVFQFFKINNILINPLMAKALYTSILSDSGSFRFQRTDAFTFNMAAALVEAGADPAELYGHLYENSTQHQLQAWGEILKNVQSRDKLSWLIVPNRLFAEYHISKEEIDGIIDILRKIKDAQVVLVFIEKSEDEIIVGLRSKNGFDVGEFARKFGGGGHKHAAGFQQNQALKDVINITVAEIEKNIS